MAAAQVSASLSLSIRDAFPISKARAHVISRLPTLSFSPISSSIFATGSPLLLSKSYFKSISRAISVSIKCEQGTQGSNSLDVWLGRLAMVGFAVAISIEIATGKGVLENVGLTAPLPTVALAITGLVGVLAAVYIFQSASKS